MKQSNLSTSNTPPTNSSIHTPSPSSTGSPASTHALTTAKVVAATGGATATIGAYEAHQVTVQNSRENTRADGVIKTKVYEQLKDPSFKNEDAIKHLELHGIPEKGILDVLEISDRLEKGQVYEIKEHKLDIIGSRTKENLVESPIQGNESLGILNNVQEKANSAQVHLKNLEENMPADQYEACSANMGELSYNATQTTAIVQEGQNAILHSLQEGKPLSDRKIEAATELACDLTKTLEQTNHELTETVETYKAESTKIKKGSSRSSMGSLSETICSNYNQKEKKFCIGESVSIDKPIKPDFGTRNSFLFLGFLFAFCFYLVNSYQKNQEENLEFKKVIEKNPVLEILIDYKSEKINLKETKRLLLNNSSLSKEAIVEILNNL